MSTDALLQRWTVAWRDLAGVAAPTAVLEELLECYREPQRAYHTLQHLAECLDWLDRSRHLCGSPAAVEIALWFHDGIYQPRRHHNEARSAAWAQRICRKAGVSTAISRQVRDLVLATGHGAAPEDADGQALVDIDLAILGAEPDRFAEYEEQVRREYAWVNDKAFARARAGVLRGFLERGSVYRTGWFRERLEARARANLMRALERWEAG